jgi:hypothetical protein
MDKQESLNDELMQAAAVGDLPALIQALADGANAKAKGSWALALAGLGGHVECVRRLIEVSKPKQESSRALRLAAQRGHAECVRLLIPVSEPLAKGSVALRWAASGGHVECVALLLPASDPLAMESGVDAAGLARARGRVEVVGMIDAFIEAKALSGAAQYAKMSPRCKSSL